MIYDNYMHNIGTYQYSFCHVMFFRLLVYTWDAWFTQGTPGLHMGRLVYIWDAWFTHGMPGLHMGCLLSLIIDR